MAQLPVNYSDLKAQLQRTKDFSQSNAASHQFIKMGKDGRWTLGADELEIEEDAEWAVNPFSFVTGWSAFDNNSNRVGEEMRPMSEPPITQGELPHVNGKWAAQVGFQLKCLHGKDEGSEAVYYARSRGGMEAVVLLLEEVYKRLEDNDAACVPVISLLNDSYKHKKYGKIYTPVLKIVEWITMDGIDTAEPEEEPEEEPEVEAEPPRRRARRR